MFVFYIIFTLTDGFQFILNFKANIRNFITFFQIKKLKNFENFKKKLSVVLMFNIGVGLIGVHVIIVIID